MSEYSWIAYLIAAVLIAVAAWFTFGRARKDANRNTRPPEPRR